MYTTINNKQQIFQVFYLSHTATGLDLHVYRVAQRSKPLSNDQQIVLNRIKASQ